MGTVRIPLTQGKVAIIDEADFALVNRWYWYAVCTNGSWYAQTHVWRKGKRTVIQMQRLLMDEPTDVFVDHEDGNGLNNCRSNLRRATRAQNKRNSRLPINSRSGYKGVYWKLDHYAWSAQIRFDGRLKHLGYFKDKPDAARAYDAAALAAFGEFARLNFPEEGTPAP